MKIQTQYRLVTYEEPLVLKGGSLAALLGGFAQADAVRAECNWRPTKDGYLSGDQCVSNQARISFSIYLHA